jgi:hypothetical protein
MAIVNGEGIGYVQDIDTWSVYQIWTDNRPILEMSVDNDDPDLKIFVGKPGSRLAAVSEDEMSQLVVGLPIVTDGRAHKSTHEVGGTSNSPGELKDHIDGMTVYQYVVAHLVPIFADVYVPKPITED